MCRSVGPLVHLSRLLIKHLLRIVQPALFALRDCWMRHCCRSCGTAAGHAPLMPVYFSALRAARPTGSRDGDESDAGWRDSELGETGIRWRKPNPWLSRREKVSFGLEQLGRLEAVIATKITQDGVPLILEKPEFDDGSHTFCYFIKKK